MSHLMLTKLWTAFQFQQLIIYKLVQFLQLLCFLSTNLENKSVTVHE